MYGPRRGLGFDGMSFGTVVLDEQDGCSRGARLAQQDRDIRQNAILQFQRHQAHQTDLNIDYQQRGFQSALSLSTYNRRKRVQARGESSFHTDRGTYFPSRSAFLIGKSQWPTRISNRRCSSLAYVVWSGQSCFFSASSSNGSFAAVEFLNTMVTR